MSTGRRFSGDFKAKVALEALGRDKTIQETAVRHKIHPNQVSTWQQRAVEGMKEMFSKGGAVWWGPRGGGPGSAREDRGVDGGARSFGAFHRNVGELLVETGCLAQRDVDRALKLQAERDQCLGPFLVSLGLVAERDLAKALAGALGVEIVPADAYGDSPTGQSSLSPDFLRHTYAIPLREESDHVVVAMADPSDRSTVEALRLAFGCPVVVQVGVISEIEAAIERQYGEGSVSLEQIAHDADGQGEREIEDVQQLGELASEVPVIRIVNLLIARALEAGASDIHVEPFPARLSVRYRIDGGLRNVEAPPARSTSAVVSRIKVMGTSISPPATSSA